METVSDHERRFEQLLREVAAAPLKDGHARLEVYPADAATNAATTLKLVPANDDACPLQVEIDNPWCLVVSVGRHGTYFEIFSKQVEEQMDGLRELACGVIDGRYEEWVLLDNGKLTASLGKMPMPDGDDWSIGYNVLVKRWFPRRKDTELVRYAPYSPNELR